MDLNCELFIEFIYDIIAMHLKQHIRSILFKKYKHYKNENQNKEISIFFFCKLLLHNKIYVSLPSFIVFISIYKFNIILNSFFLKLTFIIKLSVLINLIIVIYEKFDINSTCKV